MGQKHRDSSESQRSSIPQPRVGPSRTGEELPWVTRLPRRKQILRRGSAYPCRCNSQSRAPLLRSRCGSHGFAEVSQALFKLRADHLVAIHEQADELADETVLAIHGPGDEDLFALGLKREFHGGHAGHRPNPVHALADEFAGLAFGDSGRTRTDVLVAIPAAHRADAGIRAAISDRDVGIGFQERVPGVEFVVVVHLIEQRLCRCGNRGAALHMEVGRPRGNDDKEDGNDSNQADEDFFDHGLRWLEGPVCGFRE